MSLLIICPVNTKTATSWLLQDESDPPGGKDPPSAKHEAIPCRIVAPSG